MAWQRYLTSRRGSTPFQSHACHLSSTKDSFFLLAGTTWYKPWQVRHMKFHSFSQWRFNYHTKMPPQKQQEVTAWPYRTTESGSDLLPSHLHQPLFFSSPSLFTHSLFIFVLSPPTRCAWTCILIQSAWLNLFTTKPPRSASFTVELASHVTGNLISTLWKIVPCCPPPFLVADTSNLGMDASLTWCLLTLSLKLLLDCFRCQESFAGRSIGLSLVAHWALITPTSTCGLSRPQPPTLALVALHPDTSPLSLPVGQKEKGKKIKKKNKTKSRQQSTKNR